MKITKAETIRLVNQHRTFKAITVHALNDKKAAIKDIEVFLNKDTTVILMK
jgi:hypothetical protein